jgi:hypothetical protein
MAESAYTSWVEVTTDGSGTPTSAWSAWVETTTDAIPAGQVRLVRRGGAWVETVSRQVRRSGTWV